jgi:hypothetical protein
MLTPVRRLAVAGLPLALLLTLFASDAGRADNGPPIPTRMTLLRIEPDELTRYLHAMIQEELKAQPPLSEHVLAKLRAAALLIASQAENGRGARDRWQRSALRDNALRLQNALAERQIGPARKHADRLFDLSRAPANDRRAPFRDLLELDDLEILMKPRPRGGLGAGASAALPANRDGIEMRLLFLARKVPTAAEMNADAEHLVRLATVTAAMATLLDAYVPLRRVGNQDPNDWRKWTAEMRVASEELEGAARAKDAMGTRAAAQRLRASCADCHNVFRD